MLSDSDICPVKIYELYLSKLNPDVDFLWQRPKLQIEDPHSYWYDAAPVGCDPLNAAMRFISEKSQLSTINTNHCIRATVVTNLDQEGYEARDIMATTGHKSETSIRSYSKCPPKKSCDMSDSLANKLHDPKQKKVKQPEATVSIPTEKKTSDN